MTPVLGETTSAMRHKRELLLLLLLATLVLCAILLPLEQFLLQVQQWVDENPSVATWLVGATFALGVILLLPVSPVILLAGFLFGLIKGLVVIWTTGVIVSALTFWIGRTVARPWVKRKIMNKTTFIAIERAIERKGLLVVILTRLVMVIPYAPLNYSLGLSSVRFRDYLLGTNIGMILPFFVTVYLGTTVSDMATLLTGNVQLEGEELIIGVGALFIIVIVAYLIIRSSLKVLREELAAAGTGKSPI